MRFLILATAAAAAAVPTVGTAHPPSGTGPEVKATISDAPSWYGRDIAATAYDIPVRDLTGRNVVSPNPYFLPPRRRPHRGFRTPTVVIIQSDGPWDQDNYGQSYVAVNGQKTAASQNCPPVSPGPPSASSAIASAAHANGSRC